MLFCVKLIFERIHSKPYVPDIKQPYSSQTNKDTGYPYLLYKFYKNKDTLQIDPKCPSFVLIWKLEFYSSVTSQTEWFHRNHRRIDLLDQ